MQGSLDLAQWISELHCERANARHLLAIGRRWASKMLVVPGRCNLGHCQACRGRVTFSLRDGAEGRSRRNVRFSEAPRLTSRPFGNRQITPIIACSVPWSFTLRLKKGRSSVLDDGVETRRAIVFACGVHIGSHSIEGGAHLLLYPPALPVDSARCVVHESCIS